MKDKYVCMRCGYRWNGRVEKPTTCPRCKSYKWDGEVVDASQLNKSEVTKHE